MKRIKRCSRVPDSTGNSIAHLVSECALCDELRQASATPVLHRFRAAEPITAPRATLPTSASCLCERSCAFRPDLGSGPRGLAPVQLAPVVFHHRGLTGLPCM
jgi:hypothetical protein